MSFLLPHAIRGRVQPLIALRACEPPRKPKHVYPCSCYSRAALIAIRELLGKLEVKRPTDFEFVRSRITPDARRPDRTSFLRLLSWKAVYSSVLCDVRRA
jgi:hypothetical protein